MNSRCFMLKSFCALVFLCAAGCKSTPLKLYVAESCLPKGELVMRTHQCMSSFHEQERGLPDGYCRVDFFAIIENITERELLIGKEEFSTGYNAIGIQLRTQDGKVHNLVKKEGQWFRNLPEYVIIPPRGRLCWPVSLESSHWRNMPSLRPTIDEYLSSSGVTVEADGSFILPEEVLLSMSRGVEIQIRIVLKELLDSNFSRMRGEIESDWTSIMFGDIRSKMFIPGNTEAKE